MSRDTDTAISRHFLARIAASMRRGGLPHTVAAARRYLAVALSRAWDRRFDRGWAVETARLVEIADMDDVHSPNRARGIRYEPTRAAPFQRFMRQLNPPTDGTFVDIGCGKGRTLLLSILQGFRKTVGVEFSPSLCLAAERNLEAFRRRTGRRFEATIQHQDAIDYTFSPDDTVIYMYNPFDDTVMASVLDRLDASLAADPRTVWLMYHNPTCHSLIVSRGRFKPVLRRWLGGSEFVAYTNR